MGSQKEWQRNVKLKEIKVLRGEIQIRVCHCMYKDWFLRMNLQSKSLFRFLLEY
jgi:hypothetical protein